MRRKFIAAAASGVLALTMTAALPTIHAAAVSIWNDITPVSYTHLTLPTTPYV